MKTNPATIVSKLIDYLELNSIKEGKTYTLKTTQKMPY